MAVLAIVVVFIVLGLGVFFVAMRTGQGGARERSRRTSRRGRRGVTLGFVLSIVVLGVAVPAVVIATEKSRSAIPEANVKELTDVQKRGRELFDLRCKNCHALAAAKATARVGPDLDELQPPKALVLDAIARGRANGDGNMAARLVEGEDAEAVAAYVASVAGVPGIEAPRFVAAEFFATNCGGCHALEAAGTTGAIGPSLDEVLPGQSAAQISRSIVDPEAQISPGFPQGVMPNNYEQVLTAPQLRQLVQYLQQSAGGGGGGAGSAGGGGTGAAGGGGGQ
jgi:mono/diheme cytochrome c family protein